jgi:hypothetical protein
MVLNNNISKNRYLSEIDIRCKNGKKGLGVRVGADAHTPIRKEKKRINLVYWLGGCAGKLESQHLKYRNKWG